MDDDYSLENLILDPSKSLDEIFSYDAEALKSLLDPENEFEENNNGENVCFAAADGCEYQPPDLLETCGDFQGLPMATNNNFSDYYPNSYDLQSYTSSQVQDEKWEISQKQQELLVNPMWEQPLVHFDLDVPAKQPPQESSWNFVNIEAGDFNADPPSAYSVPSDPPTPPNPAQDRKGAKRPKTYYCQQCRKWYTTSGHLKRHLKTKLHTKSMKHIMRVNSVRMPASLSGRPVPECLRPVLQVQPQQKSHYEYMPNGNPPQGDHQMGNHFHFEEVKNESANCCVQGTKSESI